ncbi:NUDIX hydrolase [Halobacillus shinanisalinarum]|uniref:NUDIX hydrolase n=1 Tax=Halobacillus shinanisalinarum TaxID=2932258 RepID=A0ABY4H369_9BACI|nr:NUDIX hydrolase [Halobacillus shinanisalinarum]UOQ94901.1 NUDIX hydrolase [Halobacillus shinanisalinarum]
MTKEQPWKVIESQNVEVSKFTVKKEQVQLSNEDEMEFSYVSFPHGVCVLALTEDSQVIVLKQYRHAVRQWELELPAGAIDGQDPPLATAKRELLEETGYQAEQWANLGFVHPSAGSTSEAIHLFAAKGIYKAGEQELEPSEEIEMELVKMDELYELIGSGDFRHGAGLAAVLRYRCLDG